MKKLILLSSIFIGLNSTAQVTVYPNFSNFDAETDCGTSCTVGCNPVGVWRNADQYGFAQAGTDWLAHAGSTPSTNTGPDFDNTTGTGRYMYVETSGCNNTTAHLVSDIFDFTALTAPNVQFYYNMFGATMGTMHFDVDTTGLGDWVLDIIPSWTNNANIWLEQNINLSQFAGRNSIRMRIRGNTGTSFTSDMAVDDINVFQLQPNDIEMLTVLAGGGCGNSINEIVTITFANSGSDTIFAGTSIPFSYNDGTTIVNDTLVVASNIASGAIGAFSFTDGLDLSGATFVNVSAYSSWSLDVAAGNDTVTNSFLGIPIISTYPYFENFESGQNGWAINNANNGTWAFGTPSKPVINSAFSGANCFVTGGLTGNYLDLDNSFVQGPCFDFTTVCDPVLSMKVWWNAEFSWDGMNVTYSTDGGATYQLLGAFGDPYNWYNDNTVVGTPGGSQSAWTGRNSTTNGSGGWVTVTHRMPALALLPNVKIRINFGTDGSVTDDGVAFDDVRIYNGVELGDNRLVCGGDSTILDPYVGNIAATYSWSDGVITAQDTVFNSGVYVVTMTDGACIVSDSIYVQALDSNSVISLGADLVNCPGASSVLTPGTWVNSNYVWSTAETTSSITVITAGTYFLDVTNLCGVYSDTINVTNGVIPVVDLGADVIACDSLILDAQNAGGSFIWNTAETTQTIDVITAGTYSVTVQNVDGCTDSDTISVISIGSSNAFTQTLNECDGFAIAVGSNVYNTTGVYTDVLTNASGCDSLVTTDLTVAAPINSTVSNFVDSLSVAQTGATYQWIDCSTSNPIAGATNQFYIPTQNGSYAVNVTVGSCSELSACATISQLGINEVSPSWISLYPNPTSDVVTIQTGSAIASSIIVFDGTGKVLSQIIPTSSSSNLDLSDLSAGVYFVSIEIDANMYNQRVIVK